MTEHPIGWKDEGIDPKTGLRRFTIKIPLGQVADDKARIRELEAELARIKEVFRPESLLANEVLLARAEKAEARVAEMEAQLAIWRRDYDSRVVMKTREREAE